MPKLNVVIRTKDEDTCSVHCPFLELDRRCSLFGKDLKDTVPPELCDWREDITPTQQRLPQCRCFDGG